MTSFDNLRPLTRDQALKDADEELATLIGMDAAKEWLIQLKGNILTRQLRQKHGLATPDVTNHTVLTGPSGTGKTTLARILAKMFYGLGILPNAAFVEANRASLVGQYVGQSEVKTAAVLLQAKGGCLFIDEAYGLCKPGAQWDFGADVITMLIDYMDKNRGEFIVILAGYDKQMQELLSSNPGIKSRFTESFALTDYSPHELCRIFEKMAADLDYTLSAEAKARVALLFHVVWAKRDGNFGNGRFVRNVFERTMLYHGGRLKGKGSLQSLQMITDADIPVKEFSVDEIVRSVDLDALRWFIKCSACGHTVSFPLLGLQANGKCRCGQVLHLPWESIEFSSAGSNFEQLMKGAGAVFVPATAFPPKPKPQKRPPSPVSRNIEPTPSPEPVHSPTKDLPITSHVPASSVTNEVKPLTSVPVPPQASGPEPVVDRSYFGIIVNGILICLLIFLSFLALGVVPIPIADVALGRCCLIVAIFDIFYILYFWNFWNDQPFRFGNGRLTS